MQTKKRIQICQNHLADLYEALKRGNVREVQKVEHLLTPAEECVACAYIFKTSGTVREALEDFLEKEGFEVESKKNKTGARYWILRIMIFLATFIIFYAVGVLLKKLFFGTAIALAKINIIEFVFVFMLSIAAFLIVDDFLFD